MPLSLSHLPRCLTVAALLCAAVSAQAALTVYTTPAGFAAATANPGIDTFQSLSTSALTASPMNRSAGAYAYTAATPGGFYGGGTANNDPFLSTNAPRDAVIFSGFGATVRGFAGNFFASDIQGA